MRSPSWSEYHLRYATSTIFSSLRIKYMCPYGKNTRAMSRADADTPARWWQRFYDGPLSCAIDFSGHACWPLSPASSIRNCCCATNTSPPRTASAFHANSWRRPPSNLGSRPWRQSANLGTTPGLHRREATGDERVAGHDDFVARTDADRAEGHVQGGGTRWRR